jgi:hypothetical protein
MQKHEVKIKWNDGLEKDIFARRGLDSFDSFWVLERSGADIEYKDVRIHLDKSTGRAARQIACIKFEQNIKYFLKRGEGSEYGSVRKEFDAYSVVGKFGFKTAKIIAHSFDEGGRRAFILMKNIAGCICLDDVDKGNLPPETMAKYQTGERNILSNLAENIMAYQRAGFHYPDLKAKHIFVNPNNSDIYLIDLERFEHEKQLPLRCRLPFVRRFLHLSERRTLLGTISKQGNTARALKRLFTKRADKDA